MVKVLNIKLLSFIFCCLLLIVSFNQIVLAQKTSLGETVKTKSSDQELKIIRERLDAIEKNKLADDRNQTEHIKHVLSISSNTVKYVGIVAAIVLPLIIFLIGYQIIRSYQFEREIRETKKLMMDEYQKILDIRTASEKFAKEIKSKVGNLEEFIGDLATDFLHKKTSNLVSEVKAQTEQAISEIKTKDEEMKRSIELMRKLETLDLTLTPSVYIERGNIYLGQDNLEKAIDSFNKAIELKTDNFEAYFNRGRAYHKMGKFDEAINDFMKVAEIKPKNHASYANIGVCFRAKQEYEKSIQNLTKAIELNPQNEFAYTHRGLTYSKMKKYDLAVNDAKEAERLNPDSSTVLFSIGLYYGKMGDFDLAIEYYLEAVKKEKIWGTIINLAEAYICKKDFMKAEQRTNESYPLSDSIREKVISKFLLVTTLILSNKEYKLELKSIIDMLKETPDFEVGEWSFEELSGCLADSSIPQEKAEIVRKLIALLKKEIRSEDFPST